MCTQNCSKWILYIFNLLLFMLGCAGLGVGIWAYVDDDGGAEEYTELTGAETEVAAIVLMSASGVVMFISFLGCCGARTENQCLLGVYFYIMLFLMIIFVCVCVLVFAFRDRAGDFLADTLEDEIQKNYGQAGEDDMTKLIDKIQEKFDCCGVRGDFKGRESWLIWQTSKWYRVTGLPAGKLVPESCCIKDANKDTCQKINSDSKVPPQLEINADNVTATNSMLYENGCVQELEDQIDDNLIAIGIVSAATFVVILFCVVTSNAIRQRAKREKSNPV